MQIAPVTGCSGNWGGLAGCSGNWGGDILKAVAQLTGGEVWLESSIFKGEMSSAAKCNDTVSTP